MSSGARSVRSGKSGASPGSTMAAPEGIPRLLAGLDGGGRAVSLDEHMNQWGRPGLRLLMVLTAADSWPARNLSGASTTSMSTESTPKRRRSSMERSTVGMAEPGTWTMTRDAPSAPAAITAPSRTRWGSWWTSSRSFPLAGSPSAPLATMIGRLVIERLTDRHLAPTGNQAPPCPRSPLRSSSSINEALIDAGGGPHWFTCSSRLRALPSPLSPASSLGIPSGAAIVEPRLAPDLPLRTDLAPGLIGSPRHRWTRLLSR